MILPNLNQQELFDHLHKNNCILLENQLDEALEYHAVIYLNPENGIKRIIQTKGAYYPFHVLHICLDLDIPVPERIAIAIERIEKLKKRRKK